MLNKEEQIQAMVRRLMSMPSTQQERMFANTAFESAEGTLDASSSSRGSHKRHLKEGVVPIHLVRPIHPLLGTKHSLVLLER